jgi:hypothetical protein
LADGAASGLVRLLRARGSGGRPSEAASIEIAVDLRLITTDLGGRGIEEHVADETEHEPGDQRHLHLLRSAVRNHDASHDTERG